MKDADKERFTSWDVADALNIKRSQANQALCRLRQHQIVDLIGKAEPVKGPGHQLDVYEIIDDEARLAKPKVLEV